MSADFLSQEEVDALLRGVTGESDEPVADEAGAAVALVGDRAQLPPSDAEAFSTSPLNSPQQSWI